MKRMKKAKVEKTRKQVRKEQRKQKKTAKAAYFQKRKEQHLKIAGKPVPRQIDKEEEKNESQNNERLKKKSLRQKKQKDYEKIREKQRKVLLKQANEKEDKIIKKLEKQLKLNKKKKRTTVPKSFIDDGLDYILDFCVDENRKHIVETEKQLLKNKSDSGFQKDLSMVTEDIAEGQHVDESSSEDGTEDVCEDEDDFIDSMSEEELENNNVSDDSSKSGDTKPGKYVLINNEIVDEEADSMEDDDATSNKEEIWEDIYGRKRDKSGNILQSGNRYIPPGARAKADDEKLQTLRKRLKGCLNRVAEHNMHSIANQIDELYMTNSRNNMNDTLTKLMMEAIVQHVLTPNRLVSEHMMLIAILHANVGIEVGAHLLETLVKKFNKMLQEKQDVENKELDNVILMISHLYNFKIFGHRLLYQILEMLSAKFTEKEIELILLILKTVGFPLRKDDPIALKEFIQNLQQKASCENVDNSRVKFMLDVLLAIKNNNVSKIPQYDPTHVEHFRKVAKSVIRKGNAITQFNVSLEDLLYVDERGKWWVVGSAWSGSKDLSKETKIKKTEGLVFGEKILELARKQRMNTEARRNIFCILMTAEDYLDAFEKLHHLGLKDHQEREVIHVLMHCCLQENKFNPYYAILAQKLCEYERKYQLTIQYTLWDKLKTLETYTTKQLSNLARFLIHLFIEKSLAFSILKIIHFAELDKNTMTLVRQILLGILLHKNEEACLQVFERISLSPQLQSFRESLRLFINHFLIKNINGDENLPAKEMTLKKRAVWVDKILLSRGSQVAF